MSEPITIRDKYDLPCTEGKAKGEDARPCRVKRFLRYLQRYASGTISTVECKICGKTMKIEPDKMAV